MLLQKWTRLSNLLIRLQGHAYDKKILEARFKKFENYLQLIWGPDKKSLLLSDIAGLIVFKNKFGPK